LERHLASRGGDPYHVDAAPLYNRLGNACFRSGDYDGACGYYRQAVKCDPGPHLGDAYANLGTVYWATGRVDDAIEVLRQALAAYELDGAAAAEVTSSSSKASSSSPQVAGVHHQLGLAYCLKQMYNMALKHLLRARRLREAHGNHLAVAKTFDAMGKVLFCQGSVDAALLHHQQALSILRVAAKSSSLAAVASTGHTLRSMAQVYAHKDEWRAAIGAYEELLREQKSQLLAARASSSSFSSSFRENASETAVAVHKTLLALSDCYDRCGSLEEANECRHEAYLLAQDCGLRGAL